MTTTEILTQIKTSLTWHSAFLMRSAKSILSGGFKGIPNGVKGRMLVDLLPGFNNSRPVLASAQQPAEQPQHAQNGPYAKTNSYFERSKYLAKIIFHKIEMSINMKDNSPTFVPQTTQQPLSMFKHFTVFLSALALSFGIYAGTPESPSLLPDDFCTNLSQLIQIAPNGFYSVRGEQNSSPKLPNSQEWFSELGFSGSTSSVISDVPEMGNYNFRSSWQQGEDFVRAMKLEQALLAKVKECIAANGWTAEEMVMPSNSTSESFLFVIHDAKNPKFNNINILITLNDKVSFEVGLKITYSI